jgi:hypothetical protein
MVAKKVGVFPVNVNMNHVPTIVACRGSDAGSFRFAAVMAEGAAVVDDGEQWVTAGPSVGAGAELIG